MTRPNGEETRSPDDNAEVVYTTDYLKKRFGDKVDTPPAVYTNESLSEPPAEPEPTTAGAYTNEDLKQRFGADEKPAQELAEVPPPAEADGAEQPPAETPAPEPEPTLSPEERARRISEIDGDLERLERRLLAIRNPLLARTSPPTPEERAEEAGLDNAERLKRTEAKIDELRAALEELRATPEDRPDE